MRTTIISILVCLFVIASGFQALAEEWTAEQKEIWAMIEDDWEVFKNPEVDSYMEGKHDKMLSFQNDKPAPITKKMEQDSYKRLMAGGFRFTSYELKPIAINIIENVGSVFYLFSWQNETIGISGKGRRMDTYMKLNNKWVLFGFMTASCDKPASCGYGW